MLDPTPNSQVDTAPSLDEYVVAWRQVKSEEQAANGRRLEIEKAMLEMLPQSPPESVVKLQLGQYGLKVTHKLTRTVVDAAGLSEAWAVLPDAVKDCFSWRPEPITKALRALSQKDAQSVAKFVESKPAKPSFEVTLLEAPK